MAVAQQADARADERKAVIAALLAEVRRIETEKGVTPDSLEEIRQHVVGLTERPELFGEDVFPSPTAEKPNVIYLLSEDSDGRFALYLSCGMPGKQTPPHDHTTWAIIAGLAGEEENRVYRRTDDGKTEGKGQVEVVRTKMLCRGDSIAYMPDAIHSIHNFGSAPTRHFHLYGRSLEQLPGRVQYDMAAGTYKVFPAQPYITRVPGVSA